MKLDLIIDKLTELQKLYPDAILYFTDETRNGTLETYLEGFYVDEESNEIEMKFSHI